MYYTLPGYTKEIFDFPMPSVIWQTEPGEPRIQIRSHAINIIQNRRIQANVALGALIGGCLGMKSGRTMTGWLVQHESTLHWTAPGKKPVINDYPDWDLADGRTIMYINTYAGPKLMQWCSRHALEHAQKRVPGLPATEQMSMIMMDCPIGGWNKCSAGIRKTIELNGIDTIILNSFEFAGITSYERMKITQKLIELQREYNLTIIVFTTEMKSMKEGEMSRGAIGTLAAMAESVWRIEMTDDAGPHPFLNDDYRGDSQTALVPEELLKLEAKTEEQAGDAVHEKPIQKTPESAEITPESAPQVSPTPPPVVNKVLFMGSRYMTRGLLAGSQWVS